MNINKIPGFKETPEEIKHCDHAFVVLRIAGLTGSIASCMEDIEQLKKLLDDRRELLESFINVLGLFHTGCNVPEVEEGIVLVEKITGKTWDELWDRG